MNEGRQYKILGTIGKGGFGTVYKAELQGEGGFSKVVALKVLNADVSGVDEVARRLRDEARVLGLVRHRAIVQVDGLVKLDGRWAVVMEYVQGVDIKHLVAEGPLPAGPALEIVAEVASALRVAYEQPGPDGRPLCMLHRDIKPSNLQITGNGEIKVLDFGTARANFASREAKTEALAFGTVDYMSPERLEFQDVPAGDMYALGVVLFEMLTGEKLGRTSPRPDRHQPLRQDALERLRQRGVIENVIDLVGAMLAFEAADRPTARDVEQQCRTLRAGCGGPWLSDWSAQVVAPLVAKMGEPSTDDITGAILIEGASSSQAIPQAEQGHTQWIRTPRPPEPREQHPLPPPSPTEAPVPWPPSAVAAAVPEPAPARGGGRTLAVVVGMLFLFLVMIGGAVFVGFWVLGRVVPPADTDVTAVAIRDTDVPDKPPIAKPEPEPEPEVVKPPPTEPVVKPIAKPKPAVVPPTPTPKPVVKTSKSRVAITGDARSVRLVGADGREHGAGAIAPGTYTIKAEFEGRGVLTAGTVVVAEGQSVTVNCAKAFARCTAK